MAEICVDLWKLINLFFIHYGFSLSIFFLSCSSYEFYIWLEERFFALKVMKHLSHFICPHHKENIQVRPIIYFKVWMEIPI